MLRTYSQIQHTDKYSQQLNHMASLAKWLSVRLQTKWLWVGASLQLKHCFSAVILRNYQKNQ